MSLTLILIITILAEFFGRYWMKPHILTHDDIIFAIKLMAVNIGLQFAFIIYQGGLIGLQKQLELNYLLIGTGLGRSLGAVLLLKLTIPTIQVFFICQIIINIVQLILGRYLMWRSLPKEGIRAHFTPSMLRPLKSFILGIGLTSIIGIALGQLDKIILSKMLSLEAFGYYVFAFTAAGVLAIIATAISTATYPRLTQLVEQGNTLELSRVYHTSCQMVSVLLIPTGLTISLFSKEILILWTGDVKLANNASPFISILVISFILMGLMLIPYSLQLAHSWTKLGMYANILSIVILLPLLIKLTSKYGAQGACYVWVLLYAAQMIAMIPIMHGRLLKNEKWKWYLDDVGRPVAVSMVILIPGYIFMGKNIQNNIQMFLIIGILLLTSIFACMLITPRIRSMLIDRLTSLRHT